jgi:hypothetical protein
MKPNPQEPKPVVIYLYKILYNYYIFLEYYAELGGAAMHSMNIINHLPERGERKQRQGAPTRTTAYSDITIEGGKNLLHLPHNSLDT